MLNGQYKFQAPVIADLSRTVLNMDKLQPVTSQKQGRAQSSADAKAPVTATPVFLPSAIRPGLLPDPALTAKLSTKQPNAQTTGVTARPVGHATTTARYIQSSIVRTGVK